MTTDSDAPKFFHVQSGEVIGTTGQEDANAFAADFQGLRHFGNRIGEALDLGAPWLGAFQETDFTHLWAIPVAAEDVAQGAMVGRRTLLAELLEFTTTASA
jgi:hypothetical protein